MHSVVSLVFVPLSEDIFSIGPERSYDKAAFFLYERMSHCPSRLYDLYDLFSTLQCTDRRELPTRLAGTYASIHQINNEL